MSDLVVALEQQLEFILQLLILSLQLLIRFN